MFDPAAPTLVDKPQRLEAHVGRAQQREAILLGPTVGAFMR